MQVFQEAFSQQFVKIILSNPNNKDQKIKKIIIRPITLKDVLYVQFERYSATQVYHENILYNDALNRVLEDFEASYRQADVFLPLETIHVKVSKKGKFLINRVKNVQPKSVFLEHNRKKQYLLQEGQIIPPLIDLGVMTNEGQVVKSKYDKYKQINRFIEMIDDVITDETHLNIIDFGCGKSYLTFVLYYYLQEVKGIKVTITGLDLKSDVINACNIIADKYNYTGLHFENKDIKDFTPSHQVDMVISLHACNTATDYALYHGIKLQARHLFAVPCCQHEINAQALNIDSLASYGLLKERFSALLTDSIRADLLKTQGYHVDVLEFIDLEHSPKNILIRATKSPKAPSLTLEDVQKTLTAYGVVHTLMNLLKK